ncbi:MAG: hypothetical protein NPIRA04_35630 [Nitrospirales bacterium]|nr:MAG: hypothetical protein NPIRA04_35630 [Nitrospirales bacterium]
MEQRKTKQRILGNLWLLIILVFPFFYSGCIISPQDKKFLDAGKMIYSEVMRSGGGLPYIRGWKKLNADQVNTGDIPIDVSDIEIVVSTGRANRDRTLHWKLLVFQSADDDQGDVLLKECGLPETTQATAVLDKIFGCKNLPNNSQLQVLLQYGLKGLVDEIYWQDTVFLDVAY